MGDRGDSGRCDMGGKICKRNIKSIKSVRKKRANIKGKFYIKEGKNAKIFEKVNNV
jgi:hypothetical protein